MPRNPCRVAECDVAAASMRWNTLRVPGIPLTPGFKLSRNHAQQCLWNSRGVWGFPAAWGMALPARWVGLVWRRYDHRQVPPGTSMNRSCPPAQARLDRRGRAPVFLTRVFEHRFQPGADEWIDARAEAHFRFSSVAMGRLSAQSSIWSSRHREGLAPAAIVSEPTPW